MSSTLSELHEQEMGVPQGSILSPALFNIRTNNIVKAVLKGIDCSLFVDDFALCVSGKTLNRVERAMQLCVNSVHSGCLITASGTPPQRRWVFISITFKNHIQYL